jgi:hypothetical protein
MNNLSEAIETWENQNNAHRNEGRTGLTNLCKLVGVLGYKDERYFGQLDTPRNPGRGGRVCCGAGAP